MRTPAKRIGSQHDPQRRLRLVDDAQDRFGCASRIAGVRAVPMLHAGSELASQRRVRVERSLHLDETATRESPC